MTENSHRKSIVKAIKLLLSVNPNQKAGDIESLIEAWHIALEDLTDYEIGIGLKKALENKNPFLPSPGSFKEMALSGDHLNTFEEEAREAWAIVKKNLNYYSNPVFNNRFISESIRHMGGWKRFCNMLESEEAFREKDFISHYKTFKSRNLEYDKNVIPYRPGQQIKFIGFKNEAEESKCLINIKLLKTAENKAMKMLTDKKREYEI